MFAKYARSLFLLILAVFLFFSACGFKKPLQSTSTKSNTNETTAPYAYETTTQLGSTKPSPGISSSPLIKNIYDSLSFLNIERPAIAQAVRGIRRAFVPLHHRPGWNATANNPAVDCVIFNVSEEYATAQNTISPSSVQRVNIYVQNSASIALDQIHKSPPVLSKSFTLAPGDSVTVMYQGTATSVFPKGLTFEAIDADPSQQGLIQGDCYNWWGQPNNTADRLSKQHAIMGGLPF